MITEDYVSFETARLLKEKGFNEPCRLYYDKYHGYVPIFVEDSKLTKYGYKELVRNDQNSISDFVASAPSLYVAMKWLREVHNKHCDIGYDIDLDWFFQIIGLKETVEYDYPETKYYHAENGTGFNAYEEACEAAIKYCLENLI